MSNKKKQTTDIISNVIGIGLGLIASFGVGEIIGAGVKGIISGEKGIRKACMLIGAFAVGAKTGDMVEKYVKESVNDISKTIKEIRNEAIEAEGSVK